MTNPAYAKIQHSVPASPAGGKVVAYLTSQYPRASDTFIRTEVAKLRELGFCIQTFAIRRPPSAAIISDEIRAELNQTQYILDSSVFHLMGNALYQLVTSTRGFMRAVRLTVQTGMPGMIGRLKSIVYLLEAAALAKMLKRSGCQHLHNHIGENSATVAMLASAISGIPYSLTIHGPGIFYNARLWALGEKIKRSSFTACISHFCRSQCMVFAPYSAWSKICVVRCCVDPRFICDRPTAIPAAPRLVFVGRLVEEKAIALLIEAGRMLKATNEEFQIVVIGDGPMRHDINEMVREYGLESNILIRGFQSSQAIVAELHSSRALVLPSFAEGLPVVIMEALALGRPVITSRIAGIQELVDERCGWVLPPGDLDSLLNAMRECLSSSTETLATMGLEGRRRVLMQHNVERALEPLITRLNQSIEAAG